MATTDELHNALIKADAAGDTEGAKALADHIRGLDAAPATEAPSAGNASMPWGDVAINAAKNLPSSTLGVLTGIGSALLHPSDTAGHVMDLAAGELSKAVPDSVERFLDKYDPNPQSAAVAKQTATNFNNMYTDGYGSVEGFKSKLANDPASILGDISTVATMGGGLASKIGKVGNISSAAKLGNALSAVGNATNPLSVIPLAAKGVSSASSLAGGLLAGALGSPLATGVGGQSIKTAFNSGKLGDSNFIDNLSGKVPMTDVVDSARQGLSNMRAAKSEAYRSSMKEITGDKSVLSMDDIDSAVKTAADKTSFNGVIVNKRAANALQEAKAAVDQWKAGDPKLFNTPEGLDKLKQRIGDIRESLPMEEATARSALGDIYNATKDSISKQAPTYAKTMNEYSQASTQIKEIEKALSLGNTAMADTAVRKLQSLTRNNVQSNYGNRIDLAKALVDKGGKDIMPALAGQAMNSWTGRGLGAHIGEGAITTGALLSNPMLLGLLALKSPKLIGYSAYGAGKASGIPQRLGNAISPRIPESVKGIAENADTAKRIALLLQQSQQGNPE